jgi:acyl carrier protein
MEVKDFIKNFANQFDDTEISEFKPETEFRELDEWSSLIGLAILNMIEKKYAVKLSFSDMRQAKTIDDLYHIVAAK